MAGGYSAPGGLLMLGGRDGERAVLDGLLEEARAGQSGVLVLRGEAGVGKTALLEYAIESASDLMVVRAVGVESEMELVYAALHQLSAPLLDRRSRARSRRVSSIGSRRCLRTRSSCCWWPRRSRPATRHCCGARPSDWESLTRCSTRRSRRASSSSMAGFGFAIRRCARRSTGRRRRTRGDGFTGRWPRRPTRGPIPTGAPGILPRRQPALTRPSPPSSSGRPDGRRRGAVWPSPPPFWSGPRR
jgi:hypothetical protein